MIAKNLAQAIKDYFSAQNDVLTVYLYGSYACGTNNPLSDVDIAVMTDPCFENASSRQIDLAGKISELFKSDNVDVQFITSDTPPSLALSMIKGKLLYCRSHHKRAGIESQILSKYQDFVPFLTLQIKEVEKRFEKGVYAGRY